MASWSAEDWIGQALFAYAAAVSCPLAGNHSSVAVAFGRAVVACTLHPISRTSTMNTPKAIAIALKICSDGIGRAHGRGATMRPDARNPGLREALLVARSQDAVTDFDAREPVGAYRKVLSRPTALASQLGDGVPYAFVDTDSASALCEEVDRLRGLERRVGGRPGVRLSSTENVKPSASASRKRSSSGHYRQKPAPKKRPRGHCHPPAARKGKSDGGVAYSDVEYVPRKTKVQQQPAGLKARRK